MSVRSPTGAIATITRTLSTVILSASAIPSDEQQTGVDLINVGDVIPTATGHHAIPTGGANSTDILGGASSILYSTDEVTFVAFQVAGFTLMAVNICFFAVGYGTKSWLFTLLLLTVFLSYFAAAIFWFMQARGMLAGFTDAFVDVTALGLITFSFTIFLWAFFLRSQKLVPYKKTRQCSTTVASGLSLTYLIFVTLAVFTQFSLYASTTVLTTNNGGKPASATGGSHNSTTSASGNSGDLLTTTYDNLLITSIQMVPYMVYVYPFSSALISVYILLAYYVPRLKLVPLGSVLKRIWTSGLLFLATEEALHFLHASLYPVDAALHKKVHALMTGLRFFLFVAFMNATATASGDLLTLPGDPSHAKFSARGDGDRNDPVPTYTSTDREAYALRDGPKIVIPPSRGDSPKGSHGMKSPTPSAARDGLKSPDPFPTRSASRGNGYPPRKGSANAVMPAPRDASANAGTYYSSRPQNPREYEREREREREREKEQRDRDRDRDWRDRDRSAGPASPRRPTSPLSSPTRRRYDDDDARDRRPSDGGRGGGERRPSDRSGVGDRRPSDGRAGDGRAGDGRAGDRSSPNNNAGTSAAKPAEEGVAGYLGNLWKYAIGSDSATTVASNNNGTPAKRVDRSPERSLQRPSPQQRSGGSGGGGVGGGGSGGGWATRGKGANRAPETKNDYDRKDDDRYRRDRDRDDDRDRGNYNRDRDKDRSGDRDRYRDRDRDRNRGDDTWDRRRSRSR